MAENKSRSDKRRRQSSEDPGNETPASSRRRHDRESPAEVRVSELKIVY